MKKIKIIAVLILTCFICQNLFAQPFLKTYTDPSNPNASVSFECITEKMDSQDNFYIGGHIGDTITIFKVNFLGTILVTYKIKPSPANTRLDAIMLDESNQVVVLGNTQAFTGNKGFIFQCNPLLNGVNWFSETNTNDRITYWDMANTNSSFYLVSGAVATNGSGLIMKINKITGAASLGVNYNADGLEDPFAIQLSGSKIYTTGRYALPGGGSSGNGFRFCMSQFNASFQHLGSDYYATPKYPAGTARMYSTDILVDGKNAVMVGNGEDNNDTDPFKTLHITKVKTSDGTIIWSKKYDITSAESDGTLNEIRLNNYRNYTVMGFAVNPGTTTLGKAKLWSVDPSNGSILWNRQYDLYRRTTNTGSSYEYGFTIGGSYIFAVGQNSTSGITRGVLLKVNAADGNVSKNDGTNCYDTLKIKKSPYTFSDTVALTFLQPNYVRKNRPKQIEKIKMNDSLLCGAGSGSNCNCSLSMIVDGGAIGNNHPNCGDTLRSMQCGLSYYFSPDLTCDPASSGNAITGIAIHDPNGNPVNWPGGFNGTGGLAVPSGINGVYSLTYYWGSNGSVCDSSCTYYMDIACCDTTCTLSGTIRPKLDRNPLPFNCGDTASVNCNYSYEIFQSLRCNNSILTQLTGAVIKDPAGAIPTWALPFIASGGNGILAIPAGVSSGIYTLTYYWGLNGVACDSCTMYLKITCCTNFTGTAGSDVLLYSCCGGVPFNASASGGVGPYTYLWSPGTGLSNSNIANPICTLSGTYTVTITDAYGCTFTDQAVATPGSNQGSCCRTNLKGAGNTATITVSPNPTTNSFKVAGLKNKTASLEIFNFLGVKVAQYKDVSDGSSFGAKLPKGLYMLRFQFKDGTMQSLQLIKN